MLWKEFILYNADSCSVNYRKIKSVIIKLKNCWFA
jgi:hypothetical protein